MTTIAEVESTLDNLSSLSTDETTRKHNLFWGFETEITCHWTGSDRNALLGKVRGIHNDIDTIWSQCNNVSTISKNALNSLRTYRSRNNLDENGNPLPEPEAGGGCR